MSIAELFRSVLSSLIMYRYDIELANGSMNSIVNSVAPGHTGTIAASDAIINKHDFKIPAKVIEYMMNFATSSTRIKLGD